MHTPASSILVYNFNLNYHIITKVNNSKPIFVLDVIKSFSKRRKYVLTYF